MKYIIIYNETTVISINEYFQSAAVVTNDNYIVDILDNALIALTALNIDCSEILDYDTTK